MQRASWKLLLVVLSVASSLGLSACAGIPPHGLHDKDEGLDVVKVATVNRWAVDHGATVIWIKYPVVRKTSSNGG